MALDHGFVSDMVDVTWADEIVPTLRDYIRIPNVSPAFDAGWAEAGHMDRATELVRAWMAARPVEGLTVEVVQLPGRTPVILAEVAATASDDDASASGPDTVLLYGHLDKQPPMEGWREGLGPWEPVLDGDRLYGRGGADDGYAAFACMTAIESVRAAGGSHARCVVLIEASEESGSPDLPAYFDHLAGRIGAPSLVVCLDSSAPDDRRLWLTTSLRGMVQAHLRVDVLTEGIHSGLYGGIVPSSFRILRQLLDRIEDPETGTTLLPALAADVPEERRTQAAAAVDAGVDVRKDPPWIGDPVTTDPLDLLLANTWAASVAVTGIGGAPPPDAAGNVLLAHAEAALCVRLPPSADAGAATEALRTALTSDPPEGAVIELTVQGAEGGWDAPSTAPWLADAVEEASQAAFGAPAGAIGVGGTIPFMGMLGERYPDAQFAVTGVLIPGSNAHGPNEFLHLPTGRRVTAAVASLLDAHATRA